MPLTFPVDCDTPRKRVEYCYRAQELLRLIHNGMAKWRREGLTVAQWDRFPQRLKNRYPYDLQLPREQWDDFLTKVFENIQVKISHQIGVQKGLLKESLNWTINVEDILD